MLLIFWLSKQHISFLRAGTLSFLFVALAPGLRIVLECAQEVLMGQIFYFSIPTVPLRKLLLLRGKVMSPRSHSWAAVGWTRGKTSPTYQPTSQPDKGMAHTFVQIPLKPELQKKTVCIVYSGKDFGVWGWGKGGAEQTNQHKKHCRVGLCSRWPSSILSRTHWGA